MTVSISSTVETERMTCVKNTVKNGFGLFWNFSQWLLLGEHRQTNFSDGSTFFGQYKWKCCFECLCLSPLCERKGKTTQKNHGSFMKGKNGYWVFVFLMQSQRTLHPFLTFAFFFFLLLSFLTAACKQFPSHAALVSDVQFIPVVSLPSMFDKFWASSGSKAVWWWVLLLLLLLSLCINFSASCGSQHLVCELLCGDCCCV